MNEYQVCPVTLFLHTMNSNGQLLHCLKRGLSGYVTYLAACQMNEAYSEYILYEPILRILTALGCQASCEVPCRGLQVSGKGDKKRIDFVAKRNGSMFALEVKWAKTARLDVTRDYQKLKWFKDTNRGAEAYLCVFGRKSHIDALTLKPSEYREIGRPVIADVGKTRYGCRIYSPL